MIRFIRWLWWKCFDRTYHHIPGDHCGICGKWVDIPYKVRSYQDTGWYITICDECGDV